MSMMRVDGSCCPLPAYCDNATLCSTANSSSLGKDLRLLPDLNGIEGVKVTDKVPNCAEWMVRRKMEREIRNRAEAMNKNVKLLPTQHIADV